jgi:hypothetical protein
MGTVLFLLNTDYMSGVLQPGWPMLIPISAVVLVIFGNIVMNQVTKVEV